MGCFKKYGYSSSLKNKEVRERGKKTKKERYDNENYTNMEKMKQTKKEKYGNENYNNPEKNKMTCLEKYGVESVMQNKNLFEKNQRSSFKLKQFRNTNINYRGTYELDFLEHFYDKYRDLQNGPTIRYIFNNKNKVYFPDFLIPSLNLIIEIKNSYLLKRDKNQIEAKEKATADKGFSYLIIVDKNYEKVLNF